MNLSQLFDMQWELDQHIYENHPELEDQDNLDWKGLALQVELGECANEWRGFKKWSSDQEPRTELFTWVNGLGECKESRHNPKMLVENGQFNALQIKNPLLEEYVDCLHFILSIGLELDATEEMDWDEVEMDETDIIKQFSAVFTAISDLTANPFRAQSEWESLFVEFYWLGKLLGFTWKQIETAYFEKNKINHQRQEANY